MRAACCILRTANREPRTANREPRTANREPRTANREPRTANREPRTANPYPGKIRVPHDHHRSAGKAHSTTRNTVVRLRRHNNFPRGADNTACIWWSLARTFNHSINPTASALYASGAPRLDFDAIIRRKDGHAPQAGAAEAVAYPSPRVGGHLQLLC